MYHLNPLLTLLYCPIILNTAAKRNINVISAMQRKSVKIITKLHRKADTIQTFGKLQILPFNGLIKFSKCIFVHTLSSTTVRPLPTLKGNVQRKLRWVENGVNRSVGASNCGAGHSFVVLFGFHLGFVIFLFLVSTVKIIGEFWITR